MDIQLPFENEWIGFDEELEIDDSFYCSDDEYELEQLIEMYKKKYGNKRIAR